MIFSQKRHVLYQSMVGLAMFLTLIQPAQAAGLPRLLHLSMAGTLTETPPPPNEDEFWQIQDRVWREVHGLAFTREQDGMDVETEPIGKNEYFVHVYHHNGGQAQEVERAIWEESISYRAALQEHFPSDFLQQSGLERYEMSFAAGTLRGSSGALTLVVQIVDMVVPPRGEQPRTNVRSLTPWKVASLADAEALALSLSEAGASERGGGPGMTTVDPASICKSCGNPKVPFDPALVAAFTPDAIAAGELQRATCRATCIQNVIIPILLCTAIAVASIIACAQGSTGIALRACLVGIGITVACVVGVIWAFNDCTDRCDSTFCRVVARQSAVHWEQQGQHGLAQRLRNCWPIVPK